MPRVSQSCVAYCPESEMLLIYFVQFYSCLWQLVLSSTRYYTMTTNRHFCHCKTLKSLTAMRVWKMRNIFKRYYTMTTNRHFCHCKTWKSLTAMRVSKNEKHFFLIYFFFSWRTVALQNFVVFCQISTWISHRYTYIYLLPLEPSSHLPSPPNLEGLFDRKEQNYEWI